MKYRARSQTTPTFMSPERHPGLNGLLYIIRLRNLATAEGDTPVTLPSLTPARPTKNTIFLDNLLKIS
jgi:hypothetical protein